VNGTERADSGLECCGVEMEALATAGERDTRWFQCVTVYRCETFGRVDAQGNRPIQVG
jgi:hypothetical protein